MELTRITQASASGTLVATVSSPWVYDEDGDGYFDFSDTTFDWALHPKVAAAMKLSEDDFLSCIEQIEEITPFENMEKYGSKNGLTKGFGSLPNIVSVRSKSNKHLLCLFTPVSSDTGENSGVFEFFYSPEAGKVTSDTIMNVIDSVDDSKSYRTFESPLLVPTYEEACKKSHLILGEKADSFLQKVWDYHFLLNHDSKKILRENIVDTWKAISEAEDLEVADVKFGNDSTLQSIFKENLYQIVSVKSTPESSQLFVIPPKLKGTSLEFIQNKISNILSGRFSVNFNKNGTVIDVIDFLPAEKIESWNPGEKYISESKKKVKKL